MKVSVVYSSAERSDFLRASLTYLTRQSLPKEDFEVIVSDDGSEEDYAPIFEDFRGKLQMQWVRFDFAKHPIYAQMNPDGKPLIPPDEVPLRYHTPALSHNVAFKHARGEVLCITQPDVLMKEDTLEKGHALAISKDRFIFCRPWMSLPAFREQVMPKLANGEVLSYADLKGIPDHCENGMKNGRVLENTGGGVSNPHMYWWLSFLQKAAAFKIGGVDEEYLRGVYAEDDDFRLRAHRAGFPPAYHLELEGIHVNHSHLKGRWDRGHPRWLKGAEVNRARWKGVQGNHSQVEANKDRTWGDPALVTRHEVYDL